MGAVVEPRYRGSYRLELPEEREYAQRLVAAAERLGIRGQRLIAVSRLARETAWLVGLDGRGTDPRAVASAALYWVWLLEHLRGGIGEPPSPREAWSLTGSSRASFYRAIAVLSRYVLRLPSHHPLLRLEAVHGGLCSASGTCARPGSHVVGVEPGGYVVMCSGPTSCRPPRGQAVELLLLPVQASGRRRGAVRNGFLKKRGVTFDLFRLRELIRERFNGDEFTTYDFAAMLGLVPQSAGRLLYDLERHGVVEKTGESRWRLRETPVDRRKSSDPVIGPPT